MISWSITLRQNIILSYIESHALFWQSGISTRIEKPWLLIQALLRVLRVSISHLGASHSVLLPLHCAYLTFVKDAGIERCMLGNDQCNIIKSLFVIQRNIVHPSSPTTAWHLTGKDSNVGGSRILGRILYLLILWHIPEFMVSKVHIT